MKLLGFEITRAKAMSPVGGYAAGGFGGFMGWIGESFSGAWQSGIRLETQKNILAFSAVYACVSMIADDIAKLRVKLVEQLQSGVWAEVARNSPKAPVLGKPNSFQTRIQFFNQWITSKLIHGNTYVYKQRDNRRVITDLYVLDPRLVVPLVADDGSVWYQCNRDYLNSVLEPITVPASEIIHDRAATLFHPLVGISPIYACGGSATQGLRIQSNSSRFFENMSRPSGQLTTAGTITDITAERLKAEFEKNFSSGNIGRLLVTGDGLKYEPMTIPAADAQLIEQLRWTVEDVARCFHVPLFKIGESNNPRATTIGPLNQEYYSQTLQALIESVELLLEEGLELGSNYGIEMDLDGLLRMDPAARADATQKNVGSGVWTPNEARAKENLPPVDGGNTPYMQQQMWPLAQLADRPLPGVVPALPAPDASTDPTEIPIEAPAAAPTDNTDEPAKSFREFMLAVKEFDLEVCRGLMA